MLGTRAAIPFEFFMCLCIYIFPISVLNTTYVQMNKKEADRQTIYKKANADTSNFATITGRTNI
jgi:hypothetical protein